MNKNNLPVLEKNPFATNIENLERKVRNSEFGLYIFKDPKGDFSNELYPEINYIGNRIIPIIDEYIKDFKKSPKSHKILSFIAAIASSLIPI